MKILHLSDTHNKHRDLSEMTKADVLVHSGDFTMAGVVAFESILRDGFNMGLMQV